MAKKLVQETVAAPEKVVNEATATVINAGVTPRKARLVIDCVRGKSLDEAYALLSNLNKAAAPIVLKLIKSCEANAVNNFNMSRENLYIATIYANDGQRLKRFLPRAKGSASGLVKRLSNITVILKEKGNN